MRAYFRYHQVDWAVVGLCFARFPHSLTHILILILPQNITTKSDDRDRGGDRRRDGRRDGGRRDGGNRNRDGRRNSNRGKGRGVDTTSFNAFPSL